MMAFRLVAAGLLVVGATSCSGSSDQSTEPDTDLIPYDPTDSIVSMTAGGDSDTADSMTATDSTGVDDRGQLSVDIEPGVFLPPLEPNVIIDPLKIALYGGLPEAEYADAIEARVAPCMRERGWDYMDNSPMDFLVVDRTPIQAGALAEYKRTYGYGYTTSPPEYETGRENDYYWRSLDETMGGDAQDRFMSDRREGPDNCNDRATKEVNQELGFGSGSPRDNWKEIWEFVEANPIEIDDDKRELLIEQEDGWATCITDAGFPGIVDNLQFGPPGDPQLVKSFASDQITSLQNNDTPHEQVQAYELRLAAAEVECTQIHVWPIIHFWRTLILQQLVDAGLVAELSDRFTS